ncbi:MAG: Abi family protein [Pleurocapsa sp. SU_5_0]|nr:Abi family protein [Pleurocapsa sp. SU_5_0]
MQPKYSYTRPKTTSLAKSISPARLSTYGRLSNGTKADAIHLYYWNMSLSQSLYIPIQTLEVSLRNIVSNSISSVFGQDWYLQARFKKTLDGWANTSLEKAIEKATESTSKKGKLLTEGDVIANLSFGFWGALLAQRYKLSIWNKRFPRVFIFFNDILLAISDDVMIYSYKYNQISLNR